MSRIITTPKKATTLLISEIDSAITNHFRSNNTAMIAEGKKPRFGPQEIMITEMKIIINKVIVPQIVESFRLNVSDKVITEILGVTAKRAQHLRMELQAAGIIWFPEWSRQKKKGDYPFWMVSARFINFAKVEKTSPKNRKYVQRYYDLRALASKIVYAELEELDMNIEMPVFMASVYAKLDELFEVQGVTKISLLK